MEKRRTAVIIALTAALLFAGGVGWGSGNIFGAGIILGEPTGLCAKLFVAEPLAFDLALS